jgi:membrane protease YdiL (CAAX protease family)
VSLLGRVGSVFWNSRQRRLRLVWRLVVFGGLLFGCTWGLDLAWNRLGLGRWDPAWVRFYTGNGVRALSLVVATFLAAVLVDRRPWTDLGFHWGPAWWADLAFGMMLGALLMMLIFVVEWAMGWITISEAFHTTDPDGLFWRGLVAPLLIFLFVGVYEELLDRGYLLRNLAEGLNLRWFGPTTGIWLAWLLSSLLFGLAHAENPHSSLVSTLYLASAGLFLGLGYVLTGELAISIGLHITWNLFEGTVLGLPVSGIDFSQTSLVLIRQGGPSLWTGGAFGPEAGLLGLLAGFFGSLVIVLWVRWRYGRVGPEVSLAQYRARPRHRAVA